MRCLRAFEGTTMKTNIKTQYEPRIASTVYGEDIARGDYVALLNETVEVPSYLWDSCGVSLPPQELVHLKLIPCDAGQPLKVIEVCLPFVYAKSANRETITIDIRRLQIVRLDRRCAKTVWKELRSPSKKKKK